MESEDNEFTAVQILSDKGEPLILEYNDNRIEMETSSDEVINLDGQLE